MIVVAELSKNYGPKSLFDDVSLQLNAGNRYGLVGANGSGKSTFLRILSDEEAPSSGSVTVPKTARIGMLRQDQFASDSERIVDVAMQGDQPVFEALKALDALDSEAPPDPEAIAAFTDTLTRFDGYTLESRTREMLVGLGVPQDSLDAPLGTLSGGYKLRVLLAQVLIGRPDAMFLDEPTNHLDILSIRWLEQFLQSYRGCAVIISHDRRFLDAVATRILDVDYGTVVDYPGNYGAFVRQKEETRTRKEVEIAKAEREIAQKKAFVERFKAKATKARQAQSRVKQLEKIEVEELPQSSRRAPRFRFVQEMPTGKDVLRVDDVSKAYGDNEVLRGVSFAIQRGERVAIIGANGIGKSTLLKIVSERIHADAGTFEWGHNAQLGYFAQDHRDLLQEPKQTPLNFVWDVCPGEPMTYVRSQLGRMLFSGDDVDKPAQSLSGGEAARVVFARIAVQNPNILILDEPTNHLDLEAIEALGDALESYEGTVLFVSHDRHFVSRLATRVIELRRDGIHDFKGSYDDYIDKDGDDHLNENAVVLKAKAGKRKSGGARGERSGKPTSPSTSGPKAPLSWAEQKKLANRRKALPKKRDRLLAKIEAAEKEKADIAALYAKPDFYMKTPFDEIERLQERQKELDNEITSAMADWEEVEAELASLDN